MDQIALLKKPLASKLTQDQITFFKKNGYLHFPGFLSKTKVAELIAALEELQNHLLSNKITSVYGVPLRFGKDLSGKTMIQRYAFANKYSEKFDQLLKSPSFKVITDLLGPDARVGEEEKDGMVINHYVNSEHSKFSRLGWHTDSLRELFAKGKVIPMLNVGIHLDNYPKSLGGLRVLPGTHQQSVYKLVFRKSYFRDNEADPDEVGFDVAAGDLTVHDGRIWHRVAKSTAVGEKSRRRVLYIPIIQGKYVPKSINSKTAWYHKLGKFAKFS